MTIELVPLCELRIAIGDTIMIPGGPAGMRVIVETAGGEVVGERLSGVVHGVSGGDWLTVDDQGVAIVDVRLTIRTHDDALVFVQYGGRIDMSGGPGTAPIYAAPTFETGDDRYRWLNTVQAVAKGTLDGQDLTYEVAEVR